MGKVAAMTPERTMGTDDSSYYFMGDFSSRGIVPVSRWPGIVITPLLFWQGIGTDDNNSGLRHRRQSCSDIRLPSTPGIQQLKGQTLFCFIFLRLVIGTKLLTNNIAHRFFSNYATLSIFGRILPIKKGRLGAPGDSLIKELAGFFAFA
jgi:hypothetical protein